MHLNPWPLLGVLGGALLLASGCSRCEFRTRCTQEGRYETCTYGSDDGPHLRQGLCAAPNAACLQSSNEGITCVYAPATRCDASFVDHCDGSLRIYCDERLGWTQAVDCAQLGAAGCHVDGPSGKAVCD